MPDPARKNEERRSVVASGVEALIERLRNEGVAQGERLAAERLAAAAERERQIREDAERTAREIVDRARTEADDLRRAGEEALRVALRDAVLGLTDQLRRRFEEQVARMVQKAVADPDLLGRMVVAVAASVRGPVQGASSVEVVLPREAVDLEDLRRDAKAESEGPLTGFARHVATAVLRDGVTFSLGDDELEGLSIRLDGDRVRVDLDPGSVRAVILRHLQPRFRALLDGVVS
jgi:V/A-type H+-transporting ATPase subunit E